MTASLVRISDIKIGDRIRKDLGDIDSLVESIERLGLLHPIVLSDKNELICGRRRLEAYRKLGKLCIEANILNFGLDRAEGEVDENIVRKNFTIEEIAEIDQALREKEEVAAKERQKLGRYGPSGNFPTGRSREKIAARVGVSDRTLEKIRAVKEAATRDPEIYGQYWDKANSQRISVDKAYQKVKRISKIEEVRSRALATISAPISNKKFEVMCGDMRELGDEIDDDSVDLIFTDPPYNEDSIPLYGDLAILAQRVLKPGASLVTYVGHYALFKIGKQIEANSQLQYHWQLIVEHSGGSTRMHAYRVWVKYKPLLWYYKPGNEKCPTIYRDMADLIESEQAEKNIHEWEQSTKEAEHVIKSLTVDNVNHVVLDPFMGTGTTGAAALQSRRKFIGIEIDEFHYSNALNRLSKITV